MTTSKRCPECGRRMRVYREEYEALCGRCLIAIGLPRALYNDIKAAAATFEGTADEFVATITPHLRNMGRRAYRRAKA